MKPKERIEQLTRELEAEETVEPEKFISMGRATPFAGHKLRGKCVCTICGGNIVYQSL